MTNFVMSFILLVCACPCLVSLLFLVLTCNWPPACCIIAYKDLKTEMNYLTVC
jgi:hypothetical protein